MMDDWVLQSLMHYISILVVHYNSERAPYGNRVENLFWKIVSFAFDLPNNIVKDLSNWV